MAGAPIGNTNNSKGKLITDALRKAVTQNPDKLRKACLKVLDDAVDGNLASFSVIADRLDGKPTQPLDHGGQEDNPLRLLEVAYVQAKEKD